MNDIYDDMVEEAAKARWNHDWPDKPWENTPDELADYYRSSTRATLEAAAPLHDEVRIEDAGASDVVDLMATLRASVEAAKKRREEAALRGDDE